jgi:hypothetical protein
MFDNSVKEDMATGDVKVLEGTPGVVERGSRFRPSRSRTLNRMSSIFLKRSISAEYIY